MDVIEGKFGTKMDPMGVFMKEVAKRYSEEQEGQVLILAVNDAGELRMHVHNMDAPFAHLTMHKCAQYFLNMHGDA